MLSCPLPCWSLLSRRVRPVSPALSGLRFGYDGINHFLFCDSLPGLNPVAEFFGPNPKECLNILNYTAAFVILSPLWNHTTNLKESAEF